MPFYDEKYIKAKVTEFNGVIKTLVFTRQTIKKVDDYENIYSVNPLYLIIGEVDGLIQEKRCE